MGPVRAIIAGGGTGGHVIPALAIASELQARYGAKVMFIGTPLGIENKLVPAAGFELQLVEVGKLKNVSPITRARTLFHLPAAMARCSNLLGKFQPQVVIGVGGYASGPGMLAAWLHGIPTLAFEPNLVPGFANRAVARFVSGAAVHFEDTRRYFRNPRITGVPVRPEFFKIAPSAPGASPTLLVFGGSQGAKAINKAVIESLPELLHALPGLHIIHQTGERDYNEAQAAYLQAGISAEVSAFIHDMPGAFARSDLLVCRSGASTVAEVAASGKPAIFVPFPRAADDHQLRNAQALAGQGAALLIEERELTKERLTSAVAGLFNDSLRLEQMGAKARSLAHPQAAAEIAAMAAQLAHWEAQRQSAEARV
jgi:UDP-N-acetylglucosamine--N-acetylmuramyl-(pentapeptide) pyrophosphoryl-undecaprenol N-acetylglucosamine transferase